MNEKNFGCEKVQRSEIEVATIAAGTTSTTTHSVNETIFQKDAAAAESTNTTTTTLDLLDAQCAVFVQLNALPDEIIEFILTYLPPYEDLNNCKLVCKRWHCVVKNLVRRSKLNLHNGLLDFRLRWEVFSQQTAAAVEAVAQSKASTSNRSTSPLPMIAGRFSHSAVRYGDSMYVFGGGSSSDTTFNDLWRFDLSNMRWERPLSMGSYPSPKGSASMVCWKEQLILFGGWRYPSLHPPFQPWCLFDELHYYDLESNRWAVYVTLTGPPPMAGHSASVHGDCMVIFGGYQIADGINSNSNEIWCLNLLNQKWWQPRLGSSIKPQPRYGQYQMELDEKHLMIVGGCGGANSVYADAWVLDMTKDIWIWRQISVRNKKFAAPHMWCNPACKIDGKLVVLGPMPNMPQDFQMMKQTRVPMGGGHATSRMLNAQNNRNNYMDRPRGGGEIGRVINGAGGVGNGGGGGEGAIPINPMRAIQNHNRLLGINNEPNNHHNNQVFAAINHYNGNNNNNNSNNNYNNNNNNNQNHSYNLQPRCGRLSDLHATNGTTNSISNSTGNTINTSSSVAPAVATNASLTSEELNQNRPIANISTAPSSSRLSRLNIPIINRNNNDGAGVCVPISSGSNGNNSNSHEIEAANRLQRNLALRCREFEPRLPKRFDELYEDPFRMAAFNVQRSPRNFSKDHNERIRRMEEKMNAIRNSRRNILIQQKAIKEPSPKRVKRNVLSIFVCDLAAVLNADDPYLEWLESKNYGLIPGAPERLILSTMLAGHGELIVFGGVQKETLGEITHQVSNSIHFLSALRDIV